MPSASMAASAIGNWASSSRRHAGGRLVAAEQVVAERLDHAVRGAADVGRALLAEQVQQLVAQARDAGEDDPVAAEDGRPGRVVGPEQLVGGVDEVELHASSVSASASATCTTPAARIVVDRPVAVARLEVDRRDRVGQHARSRSRAAPRRARWP